MARLSQHLLHLCPLIVSKQIAEGGWGFIQLQQKTEFIFSFSCIYQHLVSAGVASSRGSQKGSRVLYQWVFFPLRKEENPFQKDHFQGQSSLSDFCACSRQIQLCSRWPVEHSGQAAALIITMLFT